MTEEKVMRTNGSMALILNRLEVPARTEDEKRFVLAGRIAEITWSAVFTIRADRIRIISVRHARRKEVRAYES